MCNKRERNNSRIGLRLILISFVTIITSLIFSGLVLNLTSLQRITFDENILIDKVKESSSNQLHIIRIDQTDKLFVLEENEANAHNVNEIDIRHESSIDLSILINTDQDNKTILFSNEHSGVWQTCYTLKENSLKKVQLDSCRRLKLSDGDAQNDNKTWFIRMQNIATCCVLVSLLVNCVSVPTALAAILKQSVPCAITVSAEEILASIFNCYAIFILISKQYYEIREKNCYSLISIPEILATPYFISSLLEMISSIIWFIIMHMMKAKLQNTYAW
ncbi:hypothetical protein SNEBB_000758 [Seison nebaliae]|nr:hypothetical protein SNEBB_000758 [Seison nebaliae]